MSNYDPNQAPPYQAGHAVTYPEESQATMVLVLGILGLVLCGLLAPFAWKMGNTELAAIDAGRRTPANRQTAKIGQILGIVGTVLIALSLIMVVVAFVIFAIVGVSSGAAGA